MTSAQHIHILDAICSLIQMITCIVLSYKIKTIINLPLKKFKIIIYIYFFSYIIWFISKITNNIASQYQLAWLTAIINLIADIFAAIYVIAFTLFFKFRLSACFKNTYLSMNKPFVNSCIAACIILSNHVHLIPWI